MSISNNYIIENLIPFLSNIDSILVAKHHLFVKNSQYSLPYTKCLGENFFMGGIMVNSGSQEIVKENLFYVN